ncbi:hypothetical protein F5890DRAFT_1519873 [Lentinula detonsa]|uniref:Uncharacterized protein n=1 Tax=Lentinula detonsa TaxID=2804962 RepID=A0AA38PY86_9AGAR|nr:hypothetical protein F5890DRAFT_1519873 [Lentinula detonsa]
MEVVAKMAPEDASNLSVDDTEIERPKSPWTTSYSVINQGPDMTVEEDKIEEVSLTDVPSGTEASMPVIKVVQDQSEPSAAKLEETNSPSRPSSPWVPSYSVSVQGSPSVSVHNSPVIAAADSYGDEALASEPIDALVPGAASSFSSSVHIPEIDTEMQSSEPEQLSEKPANEVVEAPQEVDPHLQPESNGPIERSTSNEEQAIGPDTPAADSASEEMLRAKDVLATDAINDGGKTFKTKDSADVENIAEPEEIRSESDSSREPSVPEVNVIPEISEATVANVSHLQFMRLKRCSESPIHSLKKSKNHLDRRRLGSTRIPCLYKEVHLFQPTQVLYRS